MLCMVWYDTKECVNIKKKRILKKIKALHVCQSISILKEMVYNYFYTQEMDKLLLTSNLVRGNVLLNLGNSVSGLDFFWVFLLTAP